MVSGAAAQPTACQPPAELLTHARCLAFPLHLPQSKMGFLSGSALHYHFSITPEYGEGWLGGSALRLSGAALSAPSAPCLAWGVLFRSSRTPRLALPR